MAYVQSPGRQLWLAPLDDPNDKTPFLVRDDAYTRSTAGQGQTFRLGDPISTSPHNTWLQTTWQGGAEQDTWSDKEMFRAGSADVTLKPGKLRMWRGANNQAAVQARRVLTTVTAPGNAGWDSNQPLNVGESIDWLGVGSGPSTYTLWWVNSSGTWAARKSDFDAPIMAIGDIQQANATQAAAARTLVGLQNGKFYRFNDTASTWVLENTFALANVGWKAIVPFNGEVYIGSKYRLIRRTWDEAGSGTPTFTKVADHNWLTAIENLVVWNNRLWFTGRSYGNDCYLYVSDGVVTSEAFKVPGSFHCFEMVVHYGSLYLLGSRNSSPGGSQAQGEVWRYNGSSLTKVWEDDILDNGSGGDSFVFSGASWGNHLVWGASGGPNRAPQLIYYDAELDAIVPGQQFDGTFDNDARQHFSGLTTWGNQLAFSLHDFHDYGGDNDYPWGVWNIEEGNIHSNAYTAADWDTESWGTLDDLPTNRLESSVYDGEYPAEQKVWLSARMRVKVPAASTIKFYFKEDEGASETLVHTESYDSGEGAGWRDVVFPLVDGSGDYFKSSRMQYVLELDITTALAASPEVDSVAIDFAIAPSGKYQHAFRAVATDAQKLIDKTTAHSLTTADAIVSALEGFHEPGTPVLMWGPEPTATTPTGDGTPVVFGPGFLEQSFKLNDTDAEVVREVSFGLIEVEA